MREGISRSRQNRIFGGVAAGLGEYLTIDPIVVRVLFVVSVIFSGIGILLYLIMWIVIPEEKFDFDNTYSDSSKDSENEDKGEDKGTSTNADTSTENINFTFHQEKKKNGKVIFGIILIIIGMFFLGIEIFSFLNFADLLPVILIGLGITLLWKSKNNRG
ncbi:MAG: PspC domain-containing protein [Melioribacteraceae bacterium]|nr:PspC domain-containing protein [Melioribacteraceae bacterium]